MLATLLTEDFFDSSSAGLEIKKVKIVNLWIEILVLNDIPWRTLANQGVILWIGPLGKLGHFETAAEIFLVYIASISLASGPILSITSWYAKVLCGYTTTDIATS